MLYASVADEEIGCIGARWLTTNIPEQVSAEFVVGEGGGPPVQVGSKKVYRVTVGEKSLLWLKLRAKG